jgi:P4 family phage/plasmid primase-like protien
MTEKSNKSHDAEDDSIKKFVEFMKAKAILKDRKTGEYPKNKEITHTLLGILHKDLYPYQGSFCIRNMEYDRFLKLYKNVYGKMPLYIIERHNENEKRVGPLIIDIDYKTKTGERQYQSHHFESIIKICSGYLQKYLDIDDERLKAYVTEKHEPSYDEKNKKYKDGFHIYYDIPIRYNKRKFLFDKIKKKIEDMEIFSDISHCSSYNDIVDEKVLIDNGLMMYGSHKKGCKPYELTHVYDSNINEEPIDDYKDSDDLINVFSLRQYINDDDIPFNPIYNDQEEILDDEEYYKKDKKDKKKVKNIDDGDDKNDNEFKYSPFGSYKLDKLPREFTKNNLLELIDLLSVKRATEYDTWTRVGWALYNISSKLYNLFAHFSKKAPNYDEEGCYEIWKTANKEKTGLTIASIKLWANQDNPKKYEELKYYKLTELVKKIENPNHDDIANVVVEMYKDNYKCVSIKGNSWYEFQDNKWVPVDSAYTLQEKIASDVTDEFYKIHRFLVKNSESKTNLERDDDIKQIGKLLNTVLKLKDQNYGTTLIKTCARKMYDSKFEESLDNDPQLIGFENGVFDLRTMTFREGIPDDRLTLSTQYEYKEYNENDSVIKDINIFIKKIHPNDKMREYVLRLFASCLDGRNKDQQFRLFTGSGSNGKSKIIDLYDMALGAYSGSLPPEILTLKNNNPNAATPFLADKKGMRFLVIQEPEGDSTIQVGKMKGLTGGDAIPARKNFGDPFVFRPQFKIILVCNKKPKIPSDDQGTWRRIRDIQFKSKFVGHDKVNESKHHYLRDEEIDANIEKWAPAFMWMLLHQYYPKYIKDPKKGGGLQEPPEVTADSEKYRKESDVFHEFLSESVNYTGDEKDKVLITALFTIFKDWHRDNYNHGTKFARKDLEEYLEEKRDWKIVNNNILGVKGTWVADD